MIEVLFSILVIGSVAMLLEIIRLRRELRRSETVNRQHVRDIGRSLSEMLFKHQEKNAEKQPDDSLGLETTIPNPNSIGPAYEKGDYLSWNEKLPPKHENLSWRDEYKSSPESYEEFTNRTSTKSVSQQTIDRLKKRSENMTDPKSMDRYRTTRWYPGLDNQAIKFVTFETAFESVEKQSDYIKSKADWPLFYYEVRDNQLVRLPRPTEGSEACNPPSGE